ncbi:MAG: SH3 domain-containing protein [Clostridia bacterium]|nr:SH3 domain-containing protein [Clostridia bacterium]
MTKLRRALCALLVVALWLVPLDALAMNKSKGNKITKDDTPTSAWVYTYVLTVYDKPTKDSEVLEEVPFAKSIVKLKESKGWAKVMTTNDVIGFCNAKQLTEDDPNTLDTHMYCSRKHPEVYLRPSSDAPVMGHVDRNEKVHVVAMTPLGDWLRIEENGYYCYIPRPCLDYEKYADGELAWVSRESVEVYYDPELDSKFGTLYFGQEVTLLHSDSGRAKIRSATGYIGYCDRGALTTINPNSLDITCYTQVSGNYLFTSPTADAGRRNIEANEKMVLDAVDEQRYWARVKYQDEYYYVPFVFLDKVQRGGNDYKVVSTRESANIKAGTKQSSEVIATVPKGTSLILVGATDQHARVATQPDANGVRQMGYIEIKYIK